MSKKKHFLALLASLFFFGLSFPAIKLALSSNDWFSLIYFRFLLATLLILPYLFSKFLKKESETIPLKTLLIIGFFNTMGMALQTAGMELTGAAKSAILTQLIMVFTPLFSYLLIKEKVHFYQLFAALLSMSGAVILSTNLQFNARSFSGPILGDALIILANLFWALFIVFSKKIALNTSPFIMQAANILFSFLFLNAFLPFRKISIDQLGFFSAAFLAFFCTIVPTTLYFFSLKKVSATTSAVVGPFETISAIIVAVILLKERFSFFEITGILIIFSSIYLIVLKEILIKKRADKK